MYPQTSIGEVLSYHDFKNRPNRHPHFYADYETYLLEPFQIFGNLYYVGDRRACKYIIDTGEGLILMDTGYGHEAEYIMDSIRKLGFRVEDIKIIVHSHGHYDHFGCTDQIKAFCNAKVYMSKKDTQLLKELPERALISHGPRPNDPVPHTDVELEDGDHIRLGNVDITCRLAGGHTPGTMSFFFTATDGTKTYRVGYLGGTGYNGMYKEHNQRYCHPENGFHTMVDTASRLWDEPVDITLGNHPPQNCTVEKRQWMVEHPGKNPFIDPTTWQIQLQALKENCQRAVELGY